MRPLERLIFYEMASELDEKLNNYEQYTYEELEVSTGGFWIMACCQTLNEKEKVYANYLLSRAVEVLDKIKY